MDVVEYKGASLKALDAEGKGQALIATLNTRDRENDVTLPFAFGEQYVKLLLAHEWKQPWVGDARLYELGSQVLADFEINMKMAGGRELYEMLRWDMDRHRLQEWSYGYQVLDSAPGVHEGKSVRFLKKVHAFEISPVVLAAGIGTGTLSIKSAHPHPAHRRQFWPGGLTPMISAKEHLSTAVPSVRTARRHVETARRLVGEIPPTAKTRRVNEYLDASLEELDTSESALEKGIDQLLEPVILPVDPMPIITPPKAADASPPADDAPDESTTQDAAEKGGQPLQDEAEQVIHAIERLTDRLEQVKAKRAESSPRYPHGRPMSPERLEQVQGLQVRLSRLKVTAERTEQEEAAQHELQAMTERLKRLGVTV